MSPPTSAPPSLARRSSQCITLQQVRAFLGAVDCDSFSNAARKLQMSQPALSRCIKDMESAMDKTLFLRSPHGVALSASGAAFLPKARQLLATHEKVVAAVADWRAGQQGQLNLSCNPDVLSMVLTSVVERLRNVFGHTAIQIQDAHSDDVVNSLVGGSSSIGVCSVVDHHPGMRHTDVLEAPLGLLSSHQFPLPPRIDDLSELADVPVVRFGENSLTTRLLRRHGVGFRAYSESPISVPSTQAAAELVRSGHGVAVASGVAASSSWAHGLRFVPLPNLLPVARVSIASQRSMGFCEGHERLRELLRDCIHAAPWNASVRRLGMVGAAGEEAAEPAAAH